MPIQLTVRDAVVELVGGSVIIQDVDVIVNAANARMRPGGGVDGAIHQAAGRAMTMELMGKTPHGANTGDAIWTRGHNLKQPYVIHVAGPIWGGGRNGEAQQLVDGYRNALTVADTELQQRSIAFCSISTGIYGFPLELAARYAMETICEFLGRDGVKLKRIVFSMFKDEEYKIFRDRMVQMGARFGGV